MKIVTVLGTRPEIIRLSQVIRKLDTAVDHVLVHTGQNFDRNLSEIFFDQLGVRHPNYELSARGQTAAEQIGHILTGCEGVFSKEKPDRLLILGDTNSGLCAFIAKRMGIPVFHMEAGNRCYDDRVPEEVNRRLIDHSSDILMPYTERSRANLLREGIDGQRIYVIGNPILEVIEHFRPQIDGSRVLQTQGLEPKKFFLVTLHRAENVDVRERLEAITAGLGQLGKKYGLPVVISTHPRTAAKMAEFGIDRTTRHLRFPDPFGLFDFIMLEQSALCVLSDSGTVQEECSIFRIPNVTLRDVTERPETIECGSNILSGASPNSILRCVELVLALGNAWSPPREYLARHVSDTVLRLVTGFQLELGPQPGV